MSHEIVPVDPIHDDDYDDDVFYSPPSRHQTDDFSESASIPFTRSLTSGREHVAEPFDSERLPPTFASDIRRFLRVANLIEADEPRVACLCRFHAFVIAHKRDPNSSGRGVRQFKTALLRRLEPDEKTTISKRKEKSDIRELKRVCRTYTDYITTSGGQFHSDDRHKINAHRIASVLREVLEAVITAAGPQALADRDNIQTKSPFYVPYNILPLDHGGFQHSILQLSEIKAAIAAVRNTRGLPSPQDFGKSGAFVDLFEFLHYCFGFQEGNVANQREHLILLLANIHIRQSHHKQSSISKLGDGAVDELMKKFFKNYTNWCKFLGRKNNIRLPYVKQEAQQYKILYLGLYLLIWGEAANLRFLPECLCYIFHHMAYELHGILTGAVSMETGEKIMPVYGGGFESFLNNVVTPIYKVIFKEADKNKSGTADHSTWRNYDDLNEYFWSPECFQISWPMRLDHDFFYVSLNNCKVKKALGSRNIVKEKSDGEEREDEEQGINHVAHATSIDKNHETNWLGKTNFVEIRSFWQIFRSFDRMWSFFILSLQAMIIMACHDLGSPLQMFDAVIFEDILSIFITSAILKLIQGMVYVSILLVTDIIIWDKDRPYSWLE